MDNEDCETSCGCDLSECDTEKEGVQALTEQGYKIKVRLW